MPARRRSSPPATDVAASDPLALYNQKRRFGVTPEPPGDLAAPRKEGLSFVIQKHAASRLHYDFRLELDGVLLSWSVPKGPSLDPAQKRLAVETENHPLAYGGFEGIIPAGEYGGGTVLVWDNGTWAPVEADPAKALHDGHLKFVLRGHKLRGKFALVRLKGRSRGEDEGRNWLLVKDRDPFARPESLGIVTEEEPFSVLSGRDLEAIAEAKERIWHSSRGRPEIATLESVRPAELPVEAPPWTPERVVRSARATDVPAGDGWLHERLLLGTQVRILFDGGRIHVFPRFSRREPQVARRGEAGLATWWTRTLTHALGSLPVREAWWEGVVSVVNEDGSTHEVPSRREEVAGGAELALFATDVAYLDGFDLTAVPYEARHAALARLVAATNEEARRHLRVVDPVVGRGTDVADAARRLGFPGLVSKKRHFSRGDTGAIVITCHAQDATPRRRSRGSPRAP